MTTGDSTILFGYHATSCEQTRPGVLKAFLARVGELHAEADVPFTLFVQGDLVERNRDALLRVRDLCGDLVDFQQATYTGLALKTVCQNNHRGTEVFFGGCLEACCDDVARASDAMEEVLGVRPIGLAGPLGYYRGLSDRPDILYRLRGLGIQFLRTYTRNARDWVPVPFEEQPFFYDAQGFDDMLEIPGQGELTVAATEEMAHIDAARFVKIVKKDIDYVAVRNLIWSFVQHDFCAIQDDPTMANTRAIIDHARECGLPIMSHNAYYGSLRPAPEPTMETLVAEEVAQEICDDVAPEAAPESVPEVRWNRAPQPIALICTRRPHRAQDPRSIISALRGRRRRFRSNVLM
jgi:hypothetical protein